MYRPSKKNQKKIMDTDEKISRLFQTGEEKFSFYYWQTILKHKIIY